MADYPKVMPSLNFVSRNAQFKVQVFTCILYTCNRNYDKSSTICCSSEILRQEGDYEVLGLVSCVVHNIDPHLRFYALRPTSSSWVLFTGFPELLCSAEDARYYEMGI